MRRSQQLVEDARVWLAASPEAKKHIPGHEETERIAKAIVAEARTGQVKVEGIAKMKASATN